MTKITKVENKPNLMYRCNVCDKPKMWQTKNAKSLVTEICLQLTYYTTYQTPMQINSLPEAEACKFGSNLYASWAEQGLSRRI